MIATLGYTPVSASRFPNNSAPAGKIWKPCISIYRQPIYLPDFDTQQKKTETRFRSGGSLLPTTS